MVNLRDNKDFSELLYKTLPELYRREDAKVKPHPFPLKRFLQVTGVGFDHLKAKMDGHYDLYDLDKTPAQFLPYLANMMGFDFPYEMSEYDQRRFIKVLPLLYKYKGTYRVYEYLGQVIFGEDARAESTLRPKPHATLNDSRYQLSENLILNTSQNVIDLRVSINGEIDLLNEKVERFSRFSDKFRPLNTKLIPIISLFYLDVLDRNQIYDLSDPDRLFTFNDEIIAAPTYTNYDFISDILSDEYVLRNFSDEEFLLNSDNGLLSSTFRTGYFGKPLFDRIIYADTETYTNAIIDREVSTLFINDNYPSPIDGTLNHFLLNGERLFEGERYTSELVEDVVEREVITVSSHDPYEEEIAEEFVSLAKLDDKTDAFSLSIGEGENPVLLRINDDFPAQDDGKVNHLTLNESKLYTGDFYPSENIEETAGNEVLLFGDTDRYNVKEEVEEVSLLGKGTLNSFILASSYEVESIRTTETESYDRNLHSDSSLETKIYKLNGFLNIGLLSSTLKLNSQVEIITV